MASIVISDSNYVQCSKNKKKVSKVMDNVESLFTLTIVWTILVYKYIWKWEQKNIK